MNKKIITLLSFVVLLTITYKITGAAMSKKATHKIQIIFDTGANNEPDDQHALAYLLFSGSTFTVKGVTVNATYNGAI
jgi:hypothetical protein